MGHIGARLVAPRAERSLRARRLAWISFAATLALLLAAQPARARLCQRDGDCDDRNACNGSEVCRFDLTAGSKQCAAGIAPICFLSCPPLPGYQPVCDPKAGCGCTVPEFTCLTKADCSAGYTCHDGFCRPQCTSTTDCAPGYECRSEVCRQRCVRASDCDDGDPCNGAELCKDGSCLPGELVVSCDDHDRCTTDHCSPGVKGGSDTTCTHEPLADCGPHPCTPREIERPAFSINKPASAIATTAFALRGAVTLAFPSDPPADPKTSRIRFLVVDRLGNALVDSTIVGVAWGMVAGRGWRADGAGTSWTYSDATVVRGVTEIVLSKVAGVASRYDLSVKGLLRPWVWPPSDMPPVAFLRIEWPSDTKLAAQCAEARWPQTSGQPPCSVVSATGKLVCESPL